MKFGQRVYDTWWPEQIGRIVKKKGRLTWVRWDYRTVSIYDRSHFKQFLRKYDRRNKK